METAIGDSQHYEVLSPEDIDSVKKELSTVSNRIDATKRKLVLETKLRDATQSIHRLNSSRNLEGSVGTSPSTPKGHRRLNSQGGGGDILLRTDEELQETARHCEELALDLWKLETHEQELRRKLLEHTAGVLQITHKGFVKNEGTSENIENGHNTLHGDPVDHGTADFSDKSFYRPYSQADFVFGDNGATNDTTPSFSFTEHNQMIIDIEKKVEELNAKLRDMILELKPYKEDLPHPPRGLTADNESPSDILWEQMNFLEQCLVVVHDLQGRELQYSPVEKPVGANLAAEERLEDLNTQLFNIMTQSSKDDVSKYTPPPEAVGESLQDQLDYLEGGLRALERRVTYLGDDAHVSASKLANYQERAEQYVSVIGGLWDILTASEHEQKQQSNILESPEDPSGDDFSLQAFSVKIQELHARSIELSNHKAVLTTQVQQQRELSETADAVKDSRMNAMRIEIQDAQLQIEAKNKQVQSHREQLAAITMELEATRHDILVSQQQRGERDSEAISAERGLKRQAEDATEQKIQRLTGQLKATRETMATIELNAISLKSDLEARTQTTLTLERSMKGLESEVVRLQTELTVAKADLDGAYGTRAQRAAEVATDPTVQKELDTLKSYNSSLTAEMATLKVSHVTKGTRNSALQAQIDTLQHELSETIGDYEAMTKASIEFEKEREQLESLIDTLRDRIETLDTQLNEDRVQMLGIRSPGSIRESGVSGNTSTMVLKNEFKKMIRETRAEHAKAMRVSLVLFAE